MPLTLRPLALLSLLALALLAEREPLPGAPAQPPAEPAAETRDEVLPWAELLARDARISFTPRTSVMALADLDAGGLSPRGRAEALMAVALGRGVRYRARLESAIAEGSTLERCGALLALGELGAGGQAKLIERFDDPDPEVAESALLAAMRMDRGGMRDGVDRVAGDPENPLAEEARRILLFGIDPASAPPSRAARRLLELRWGAAQRYGLIDGRPWKLVLLARLEADPSFLEQLVLRGAAELDEPAVRDQLLGHLLERGGEAAVRAAARGMPDQLAELLLHGLWETGPNDWQSILDEIERDRTPLEARRLLLIAAEKSPQRLRALELLARVGDTDELGQLSRMQADLSAEEQIAAAAIWGATGSRQYLGPLADLARQRDERVRAAAVLNRARLDDMVARLEAQAILLDPDDPARETWIRVALPHAHDPSLQPMLEEALHSLDAEDPLRLELASALAQQGRSAAASVVRAALREEVPPGPLALEAVRGIGRRPELADRELLARLFPLEGRLDVNVELALGLIEGRDSAVLPLLRAALWSDPFEISVLAAALVQRVGGVHTLRQEIDRVPETASSRDLRRVGFAMGLLGGIQEVQWLATRRGGRSGDPVVQGAYLGALASRTF